MTLQTPSQRSILLLMLLVSLLVTCRKQVTEPEYDNPFDETSSAYVPTPSLNTAPVSNITALAAITGGVFENNYGKSATSKGVCWSLFEHPSLSGSCTNEGPGTTSFTSTLTNLLPDTLYYVRAYATNEAGTIYGGQRSFRTRDGIPVFSGLAVTEVSSTGAKVSISVDDGGRTISSRGVCYSTSPNPTSSGTCVASGSGMGTFNVNLSGLTFTTIYYVRPYAANSVGTAYGTQSTFTTLGVPTVTTGSVSAITASSATVTGNVTSAGGSTVSARGICYATTQNPTTANTCFASGSGTGSFIANLIGLSSVTTYYVRAYSTNSAGTAYGSQVIFTTTTESVTDIDGNVYPTVQIGTQLWMAANLKTTRYRTGVNILNVANATSWASLTTGAWVNYDNVTANNAIYGKLYNWYAVVSTAGLCPTGWHVPSDSEWTVLSKFLATDVGFKMKSTTGWDDSGNGSNESGFNGLPGGYRSSGGTFDNVGRYGGFWSSTQASTVNAWYRNLYNFTRDLNRNDYNKERGFSVRCLRD